MYQLRFRHDLQGFGRVLLAMFVEGREGRHFYVPEVLVDRKKRGVVSCSQVMFLY